MNLYRISLPVQTIPQKFTTLAAAFRDISGAMKPVKETPASSAPVAVTAKPQAEQQKTKPDQLPLTEVKPKSEQGSNKTVSPAAKQNQPVIAKPVAKAQPAGTPANDNVVYRVQFTTVSKPKGSYDVTFAGKKYKTFEYRYSGAYRECAGEFQSLSQASVFQKIVMKNGYPDAFVVAFKNNIRSTDPGLFGK